MKNQVHRRLALFLVIIFIVGNANLFAREVIRILAIGNSFSVDAVESYLDDIAAADGVELVIGNMNIGGCSLERHWKNASENLAAYTYKKIVGGKETTSLNKDLISAIKDEKWDYITFQQVSQNAGLYETYFPYLTNLKQFVKNNATNPNLKFAFQQTWAYAANSTHTGFTNYNRDQQKMYNAVVTTVKKACSKGGIKIIIPTGTAIQNARSSVIGDNLCRDGFHLSFGLGRYTAACVWYEKLVKKPVIGNSFVPEGITKEQANIVQMAAHCAIKKPYKVSFVTSVN